MKFIVSAMAILLLPGCATVFGTAHYSLERYNAKTGDMCRITIASRRDVQGPNDVAIDENCGVKVTTGNLAGGGLSEIEAAVVNAGLNALLGRVPQPVQPATTEPQQ